MTNRVSINEVAMRDGLQMESDYIETADKVALINSLSRLGYRRIEVSSFTSPKAIPMLRDASEVFQQIDRVEGVAYTALIPNLRGAERAATCAVDEFNLVMSVTETHNLCNLRMTRQQSFAALGEVARFAHSLGVGVNASLSCAFGCPMEGEVSGEEVSRWCLRLAGPGYRRHYPYATLPAWLIRPRVSRLCEQALSTLPGLNLTAHFHNTRGMGLANVVAALDAGVSSFDSSLGGLGGCPYAPGATGNVATDEVVHMLNSMGFETGIMLEPLREVALHLQTLVGHPLSGQIIPCR